jgi:hypothetical protein
MRWLVAAPTFAKLLVVELWFSFFFGVYNGAMVPLLTEIMPQSVRTAAFSLAYSLATALFGGFTPAICTYLIARTGNTASPALWLMLTAAISLIGVAFARGTQTSFAADSLTTAAVVSPGPSLG